MAFTRTARRLGLSAAIAAVVLQIAYAAVLGLGLLTLPSPDEPIGEPLLSVLEILILLMMPALVVLMVAVHAWAPVASRALALAALAFMVLVAGVTCGVHFVILTLGRQPAFAGEPWQPLVLSFRWPSVVYALDILAWDVFFPLAMFLAAPVFAGGGLAGWIRRLMVTSGLLSLAGLAGVATGDMQLRNVGIVGYVGVFVVVAALLAVLFKRTAPSPGG
ncbi:MAG: hypothetical protein IH621_17635 [Krumholzibacteria bacterium]|nr:hypothetical protein [Candidatus Krumholzibacteria bacterium]